MHKWKETRPRSIFILLMIQGIYVLYPLFQRISLAFRWDIFTAGLSGDALATVQTMATLFSVTTALNAVVFLLLFSGWEAGFWVGVVFYLLSLLTFALAKSLLGGMLALILLLLLLQPSARKYYGVLKPKDTLSN